MNNASRNTTSADLFAGIGGMRIGFESAGFETIYANDFDKAANKTYELNFGEVDGRDLFDVIEDYKGVPRGIDVVTGGFPCQPFSVAGHKKGFDDPGRGNLLFGVVEFLKKRKPSAILLENVKHLTSHDDERTFSAVYKNLESAGYRLKASILDSSTHGGVPQNRERVYIAGFRLKKHLDRFRFPRPIQAPDSIVRILEAEVPERYYYTKDDECIYPKLDGVVKRRDRVYQYRRNYVRESATSFCPTLMANMGLGGHNVPIILTGQGIRKLTPRECARLQGFPESFRFPDDAADAHLYKQIGNSVTVPLVRRIADEMRVALYQ